MLNGVSGKPLSFAQRMACAGVLLLGVVAATTRPAFSETPYQASDVEPSCVSKTSCKFTFPAPAGKLTILHASCSIVTTPDANYNVGVNYYKIFTPDTPDNQDFLKSTMTSYNQYYLSQLSQVTMYFVAPGSTPVITMHSMATIVAPGAIDTPTCFISGLVS